MKSQISFQIVSTTICLLSFLAGSASAIARSKYLRDVELATLYGLDPDLALNDPGRIDTFSALDHDDGGPKGEFVEVVPILLRSSLQFIPYLTESV